MLLKRGPQATPLTSDMPPSSLPMNKRPFLSIHRLRRPGSLLALSAHEDISSRGDANLQLRLDAPGGDLLVVMPSNAIQAELQEEAGHVGIRGPCSLDHHPWGRQRGLCQCAGTTDPWMPASAVASCKPAGDPQGRGFLSPPKFPICFSRREPLEEMQGMAEVGEVRYKNGEASLLWTATCNDLAWPFLNHKGKQ